MMRPNINPSNQICLRDILPVEKLMKVYRWVTRQIHIPHRTRAWLAFFTFRNSEIVTGPVGIVQEAFGTHYGL